MQSSPVIVLALSGEGAILRVRELIGPQIHAKRQKALFAATTEQFNAQHGSCFR